MATARPFLVAGRWQQTASTAKILNPYDGRLIAEVCQAGRSEIEPAIQATIEGARVMRNLPGHARSSLLLAIARLLQTRQEEGARIIAGEAGKPISDARREVGRAIQTFSIAAEEARRIGGDVLPLDWTPGTESYWGLTRRFPLGAVLGPDHVAPRHFVCAAGRLEGLLPRAALLRLLRRQRLANESQRYAGEGLRDGPVPGRPALDRALFGHEGPHPRAFRRPVEGPAAERSDRMATAGHGHPRP